MDRTFYKVGWGLLITAVLVVLFFWITGIDYNRLLYPCVLYTTTGYYCPGCGGTRAVRALVRGNIGRSFLYYPLVPIGAVMYAWFMISNTISVVSRGKVQIGMKFYGFYLWGSLVLIIGNWIVKNIWIFMTH